MSISRFSGKTKAILAMAAGLVIMPRPAAATTYTDALNDIDSPEVTAGSYVDLASCTVTSTSSNITFQINVNPSADLTQTSQEFANYEVGIQTDGSTGSPALLDPFNDFIGISTGMNYFIGAFPSGGGGADVYSCDVNSNFTQIGAQLPALVAPNTLTFTVPLTSLGLAVGSSFNFDVWSTFGNPSGQGAYDALDNPNFASGTNNVPYANPPAGFTQVAYDAATATGSTFASTIYTVVAGSALIPTWTNTGSGDWNVNSNWMNGIPNAVDAEADFTSAITANHTVYTDAADTVGLIKFNNAFTYVLTGAGSLTMQTSVGSAQVVAQAGTQEINLPLTLASNTIFNVSNGATLVIADPLTVNSGLSLTTTGTGTINYESNLTLQGGASMTFGNSTHAHNLNLQSASTASLTLGSKTNLQVDSLGVGAGSTLDLTNNSLTIDYGSAANDPLSTILPLIISGYNGGAWTGTGITSSTAAANHKFALGYFNAAVDGGTPAQANQLTIEYTLAGDANLAGSVGIGDLLVVAQNFGKTGKDWAHGNFTYAANGAVGISDLLLVAQNFSKTVPVVGSTGGALSFSPLWQAQTSSVPEPASIGLVIAGGAGLLARRRSSKTRRLVIGALLMLGAGLTMASKTNAQVTYTDALGEQTGPAYCDLASTTVSNDPTNVTFQINVNPSVDLTQGANEFANYEIGLQTGPGGSTALNNPFGNEIGISTGMNYWIGAFLGGSGGAEVFRWNGTTFTQVGATLPVTIATNSVTFTVPQASIGLMFGGNFNFDVWTTFGAPQSAYDALDNPNNATAPGLPYTNGATPPTPYDSATAVGSTFSTTVYSVPATATVPTWELAGSGDWNVGNNWFMGSPNGVGVEADLLSTLTANHTVYTDIPITLGTLKFNNAFTYVVAGAGSLTMQTASGPAQIIVQQGTQEINLPLTFASNGQLNVSSGASLIIADPVTVNAGKSVTETGNGGTVTYESTVTLGAGASLSMAGPTNLNSISPLSLGSGSSVNVNSSAAFNYGVGNASPALAIAADLASGYNHGTWTGAGINSSAAAASSGKFALGYADGSTDSGTAAAAGQVLVKLTLAGDANLDGSVGVADLLAVAQHYNTSGNDWARGNFTYDAAGNVGIADLLLVAQNFDKSMTGTSGTTGSSISTAWQIGTTSVPEPTCVALALAACGGLLSRRRRA